MLSAIIFDFDGVIVDTEPLHYKAFQKVLAPLGLGYSWEEYVSRYIGFDDRDGFREAFRSAGRHLGSEELHRMIDAKAAAFQQTIAGGVDPYPGVIELVTAVSRLLPVGLCSGALPSDIEPILAQLGITDSFAVIVTASDVSASKPDPESYALTVNRLAACFPDHGIIPGNCLAIEDTPAGISSATGAGLKVLAVTNSYPQERLDRASRVVPSLAGVNVDELRLLF